MKRLLPAIAIAAGLLAAQESHEAAKPAQHGESSGGPEEEKDYTGWKWANFAILVAGLGYLAVKNAAPYFASRDSEIRKGLDEARKLNAESEARAREIDARLAGLDAEVEKLKTGAAGEAAAEGERIRKEATLDLQKIQAQADHEIASAAKVAQAELRAYSAHLALQLARRKVEARMTGTEQDGLIREFVQDMKVVK
jgi:F-type H+-transporting ATPase subunit b